MSSRLNALICVATPVLEPLMLPAFQSGKLKRANISLIAEIIIEA